jgi:hypothetical protein
MTVVANGHSVMGRLFPSGKMIVHRMAIGTRLWIVTEIRTAIGVHKRVTPCADERASEQWEEQKRHE